MNDRYFCGRIPLWKFLLLAVCGFVIFIFLYGLAQSLFSAPIPQGLKILSFILCAIALSGAYYAFVRAVEKRPVDELGTSTLLRNISLGLLVSILFFGVVSIVMYICGCYRVTSVHFVPVVALENLALFLVVAVAEEIIFRGIIFRMIWQRWGVAIALAVSALMFGFIHYLNPSSSIWTSLAIALEAGLLLGAAYVWSDDLWLPIGIHWGWNFIEGPVLGLPVSGALPGYSILTLEVSGSELITGGAFGPEGSLTAVVTGLAITAFFLVGASRKKRSISG